MDIGCQLPTTPLVAPSGSCTPVGSYPRINSPRKSGVVPVPSALDHPVGHVVLLNGTMAPEGIGSAHVPAAVKNCPARQVTVALTHVLLELKTCPAGHVVVVAEQTPALVSACPAGHTVIPTGIICLNRSNFVFDPIKKLLTGVINLYVISPCTPIYRGLPVPVLRPALVHILTEQFAPSTNACAAACVLVAATQKQLSVAVNFSISLF